MRTRSLKLQRAMRVYRQMVGDFLNEHSICEFPLGCDSPAEMVHHRRGRRGRRLLDQNYWAGSCARHNQFAEDNTGEALACGWLLRIESVEGGLGA